MKDKYGDVNEGPLGEDEDRGRDIDGEAESSAPSVEDRWVEGVTNGTQLKGI